MSKTFFQGGEKFSRGASPPGYGPGYNTSSYFIGIIAIFGGVDIFIRFHLTLHFLFNHFNWLPEIHKYSNYKL